MVHAEADSYGKHPCPDSGAPHATQCNRTMSHLPCGSAQSRDKTLIFQSPNDIDRGTCVIRDVLERRLVAHCRRVQCTAKLLRSLNAACFVLLAHAQSSKELSNSPSISLLKILSELFPFYVIWGWRMNTQSSEIVLILLSLCVRIP